MTTQLKPINVSLEEKVSASAGLLQRDPSGALQQVVYCYFRLTSQSWDTGSLDIGV